MTWTGWWSDDGLAFRKLGASAAQSFTVAKILLVANVGSTPGKSLYSGIHWIRRDYLTLTN